MRALDRVLLLACGALMLAGPVMAVQEYAKATQASGVESLTGETMARDYGYRQGWQVGALVLVLLVGGLGTLQLVRVGRAPRVRSVSARLLALLMGGMVLLDLAFLLDRNTSDSGFLMRLVTVAWLYPAAAIVVALAASRLSELEDAFGERRTPAR